MSNPICGYDFTAFKIDLEETKKLLNTHCKQWVFQEEIAPSTGTHHYQGRLSLKTKERLTGAIKKFPGWHLSPTLKENVATDFYVTKSETRHAGPWRNDDPEPIYIPRQIREIQELRLWQKKVVWSANKWDPRTINVIVDTKGNSGKSILSMYCVVHKIGERIPFANDFRDMMRMVANLPTSKMYIFDIPRALDKKALRQFFGGIEEIKSGCAFDDRYEFKRKIFDSPTIWVFTNTLPDAEWLSHDRWKFWEINEWQDLVELNPKTVDMFGEDKSTWTLQDLFEGPQDILIGI